MTIKYVKTKLRLLLAEDKVAKSKSISHKAKPVAKRHHMVSSTLAPFYTVFGLKLGCSGAAAPIGDKVL